MVVFAKVTGSCIYVTWVSALEALGLLKLDPPPAPSSVDEDPLAELRTQKYLAP